MPQKIGSLLDSLGVEADLPDDALVDGAVVVFRYHSDEGTAVDLTVSEGMDWVTQTGLLAVALEEMHRGASGREY